VARNSGLASYLIEDETAVRPEWLRKVNTVAVTAGASAPEHLVMQVVRYLQQQGFDELEEVETVAEDVRFALPPELISLAPTNVPAISST
jgi:4-hydroxy-3-methylbut-2-enyl diphosphate reductase